MTPDEIAAEAREFAEYDDRRRRSFLPEADDHLVLVRITIKRWNVIQWWFMEPDQDWKKTVAEACAATVLPIDIRNALRTARACKYRRPYSEELLGRRVYLRVRPSTLRAAMTERLTVHSVMRGLPRKIAYEYTGKRLREQQTFEARNGLAENQP